MPRRGSGATPGRTRAGPEVARDGWIPPILDESVLDGRIIVGNRHAAGHAKRVMLEAGLFVGVSSGAVMHGALRVAKTGASRMEPGISRPMLTVPLTANRLNWSGRGRTGTGE